MTGWPPAGPVCPGSPGAALSRLRRAAVFPGRDYRGSRLPETARGENAGEADHAAVLESAGPGLWRVGAGGGPRPHGQDGGRQPVRGVHLEPSVSEYVLLGEAGFEPLGFVVGSSIYHVGLQIGRWSRNQELQVLTQAMYHARELAMDRTRAEADQLSADGIVGVQLRMQMYAWGQNCLEFVATGTAVRHLEGQGAHRAPDGRAFTSDLSAQDFFRLLAAGVVPVAFVLGTCVYHIAHQGVMQSLRQAGQNQEMMQFTQGVYEARELALARMQAEADAARVVRHRRRDRGGQEPRLGRARHRVPGHRHRRAPARDEHRLPETSPKPTFTRGLDA